MIELWIDNKRCDIDKLPIIPIDFDIDKLTSVEGERSGRRVVLELPSTPMNDLVFGPSRDVYAVSRFNAEHHTASVRRGGVDVFGGTVHLLATTIDRGGEEVYKIRICEGGAEWIDSVVHGELSDLKVPFAAHYTLSTIAKSWNEDSAVLFLPVWRGGKSYGYSASALPVEHIMLTDDYHPFVSIAAMVKAMFADLGYALHSDFFDSELGQSLYMSGDYVRGDASAAKSKCDFFASRSAPVSATADSMGRVYATTSVAAHSVKAIVDTVDPEAIDSDGVQMIECFNTFNAFSINSAGNICFSPKSSVKAGFLLHLEYTTDYRIVSRDRFAGFDTVGGVNVDVHFSLANTFKDYRNSVSADWQYRAVVFDHVIGREYNLMLTSASGQSYSMGQWSSRSALVTTSAAESATVQLYYRDSSTASWSVYQDDWALYAGYLDEEGELDVVVDIRFPSQDISAGENYLLDKFWFEGADRGMRITIGNGTTLRPYFTTVPGYGSYMRFEDIAPRNIRQSELLAALGEMFNLAFYTDRERKEVHIEPLESLYDDAEVIDISNMVDYACNIEVADSGLDTPQTHQFAYKDGDKASNRYNSEKETILGAWSYRNPLYGTTDAIRVVGNRIFTTTVNTTDVVDCAPSASLIQVGDVGEQDEGMDRGFLPHIVCYKGLQSLPNGECWIAGDKLYEYPYAAFVDNKDVNLGFEMRNGVEGLRIYHLPQLLRQTEGQRVTLDLTPTMAETASILMESGPKPSIRKTFRFAIQGESSLYRIVKIGNWDTENGVVRCTFERILKD